MIRIILHIVLVFLLLISCEKKENNLPKKQEITKNALPPIEQGTLNLGDSAKIATAMEKYNKANDKMDSLWVELAGKEKPSEKKRPDFKKMAKMLLDTVASIKKIVNSDDDGYVIDRKQLYRHKDKIDGNSDFDKIELATSQLRQEATIKAIENLQAQFKIPEDNMLIEEFRKDAGKASKDMDVIALTEANKEQSKIILADYFNIDAMDVEMMAKVPASTNFVSYKAMQKSPENGIPREVSNYINTNQKEVSKNFKKRIARHQRNFKYNSQKFAATCKFEKATFLQNNPNWYSSELAENFYTDEKGKVVYLPLGKLSFADKLISHYQGENGMGDFSEGCIGEPDIVAKPKYKDYFNGTICNLGKAGVLVVQFTDNVLIDVNGPDLYVFEMGKVEPTKLELSKDGQHWINIGKIKGGTAFVDIHNFVQPNETFNYLRLTDLKTYSGVPGADIDAIATIGGAFRLSLDSEVLFDTGKYNLKKEGKEAIAKLAKQVKALPKGIITIEGHTDNVGNDNYNMKLSQKRAHSVAVELKKSIPSIKFQWKEVGYGKSRPIVKNDSDANRKKNRRVEILVLPIN